MTVVKKAQRGTCFCKTTTGVSACGKKKCYGLCYLVTKRASNDGISARPKQSACRPRAAYCKKAEVANHVLPRTEDRTLPLGSRKSRVVHHSKFGGRCLSWVRSRSLVPPHSKSAPPPKADTRVTHRHVCFRPIAFIQASRRAAAHITHVRIIPLAFGKEGGWIAGRTYGSGSTIRRYRCQVVWPSTGSVTRSPRK